MLPQNLGLKLAMKKNEVCYQSWVLFIFANRFMQQTLIILAIRSRKTIVTGKYPRYRNFLNSDIEKVESLFTTGWFWFMTLPIEQL